MAIGHAVRGAASAALALIALEAITTTGSGRVASFFGDVSGLIAKAISPDVPLVKDRRTGGTYDADGNFHPTIPDWLGGGTTTAPGSNTSGQRSNPNFRVIDPAPAQRNPAYGNQPGGIEE
jgi:hypothetical protein